MAQKKDSDQSRRMMNTALDIANAEGWDAVTPARIARRLKTTARVVESTFPDRWAVVAALLRGGPTPKNRQQNKNWRDALFDACMDRIDTAQEYRTAFLALPACILGDRTAWPRLLPAFHDGMAGLLRGAGAPASPLHTMAFAALYLSLVETWRRDDTPDCARTMAALDQRLSLFEKIRC